jgi:hypothetical protein
VYFNKLIALICLTLILVGTVGCGGGETTQEGGNQPPKVVSLTASPDSLTIKPDTETPNDRCTVTCVASDPNGDTVNFSWHATSGAITGTGSAVTWVAPSVLHGYSGPEPAMFAISVTVDDGKGGTDSATCDVYVHYIGWPTPTLTAPTCEQTRDAIQAALDAYHAEHEVWPTADGEPGDIDWTKLVPDFMEAIPADDVTCDWQVNAHPVGKVCVIHWC